MKGGLIAVGIMVFLVVIGSATSYAIGTESPRVTLTVNSTATQTSTSTLTTTIQQTVLEAATDNPTSAFAAAFSQATGLPCYNDSGLSLGAGNGYYYLINVDYPGQWGGVASIKGMAGPSDPSTVCFTGDGNGIVVVDGYTGLTANSTLQVTVNKLDGSNGDLLVTFDSITNSTSAPYGSMTLAGTPYDGNGPHGLPP